MKQTRKDDPKSRRKQLCCDLSHNLSDTTFYDGTLCVAHSIPIAILIGTTGKHPLFEKRFAETVRLNARETPARNLQGQVITWLKPRLMY